MRERAMYRDGPLALLPCAELRLNSRYPTQPVAKLYQLRQGLCLNRPGALRVRTQDMSTLW